MPLINYPGNTSLSKAIWRATQTSILDAAGLKRILDHMGLIKGAGDDWVAVAVAAGCVPADATQGQATYNAINQAYAYALGAHDSVLVFDKLQG